MVMILKALYPGSCNEKEKTCDLDDGSITLTTPYNSIYSKYKWNEREKELSDQLVSLILLQTHLTVYAAER